MKLQDLLYRQKSRWQYHTATSAVEKIVAELNRDKPLIASKSMSWFIPEASVEIPKGVVDNIFCRFDLFLQNMRILNGRYEFGGDKLYFLFDGFKFQIVSSNELFIINEVFVKNCYNFSLPHKQRFNVIDIGMNVGVASLFFAGKAEVNSVFSFEPFTKTFEQAKTNFFLNKTLSEKITAFNFGLGKGTRREISYFNPDATGTSGIFLKHSVGKLPVSRESINIKDAFNAVLEIIRGSEPLPFLIKVDCEGAEYEIMESLMEAGFPDQIIAVLLEWHGSPPRIFEAEFLALGFKVISTNLKHNTGLIYAVR